MVRRLRLLIDKKIGYSNRMLKKADDFIKILKGYKDIKRADRFLEKLKSVKKTEINMYDEMLKSL